MEINSSTRPAIYFIDSIRKDIPASYLEALENARESSEPEEKKVELSRVTAWPGARFLRLPEIPTRCECPTTERLADRKPFDPNLAFYERRDTPWLSNAGQGACDDQVRSAADQEMDRAHYLDEVIVQSNLSLHRLYDDYHDFRHQLCFLNPDLGKKHFGFTLGPDQQIKITDPDGVLTAAELGYLTEKLNGREHLKSNLHAHARTVMELVDHLTEKFADQYVVTLENYHKIIDYGQIFTRNNIGNFMDTWAYQVERHADKRKEDEQARGCRIDVHA